MNFKLYLLLVLTIVSFSQCKKDAEPKEPGPGSGPEVTQITDYFLSLSDVHIDPGAGTITYGDDTGDPLWKEAKRKVEAVLSDKKPKFMVYLGDLPAHMGRSDSLKRIKAVDTMLSHLRNLKTKIPIFYLPGNNDSPGGDYHSFTKIDQQNDSINPFYGNNKNQNNWPILNLDSTSTKIDQIDYNSEFGYYSATIHLDGGPLNIIALNTVIFTRYGYYNHYRSDDKVSQQKATEDQYSWFSDKLDGYAANDKVLLMMHIPPGMDGYPKKDDQGNKYYVKMWNDQLTVKVKGAPTPVNLQTAFLNKIGKSKPQIKGILTSHTHLDGLRRLHDSNGDVVSVSFSTPGITINHSNNPGFKIFKYIRSNFDIVDYITYYATPQKPGQKEFQFKPDSLFSFKEVYAVPGSSTPIISAIKGKTDQQIIATMKNTMYLKSGNNGAFNFAKALDAYAN